MKQRGKVLVIEDDDHWHYDIKECLINAGFHVEVVTGFRAALAKVQKELFHFITIDMQLKETTTDANQFEGWDILDTVNKLRIQDRTPVMVITGFEQEYHDLEKAKKAEPLFFMGKGSFDEKEFISIVIRETDRTNLRFKDDHRESI